MKIKKEQLKKLVQEEVKNQLNEQELNPREGIYDERQLEVYDAVLNLLETSYPNHVASTITYAFIKRNDKSGLNDLIDHLEGELSNWDETVEILKN